MKADVSMRPKRIEITTGPAKRKNGQRDPWSHRPNPLDSLRGLRQRPTRKQRKAHLVRKAHSRQAERLQTLLVRRAHIFLKRERSILLADKVEQITRKIGIER